MDFENWIDSIDEENQGVIPQNEKQQETQPSQSLNDFWGDILGDVATGKEQSAENKIENNPEIAQESAVNLPAVVQETVKPLVQEANQIGDGDARTDEVNDEALKKVKDSFWDFLDEIEEGPSAERILRNKISQFNLPIDQQEKVFNAVVGNTKLPVPSEYEQLENLEERIHAGMDIDEFNAILSAVGNYIYSNEDSYDLATENLDEDDLKKKIQWAKQYAKRSTRANQASDIDSYIGKEISQEDLEKAVEDAVKFLEKKGLKENDITGLTEWVGPLAERQETLPELNELPAVVNDGVPEEVKSQVPALYDDVLDVEYNIWDEIEKEEKERKKVKAKYGLLLKNPEITGKVNEFSFNGSNTSTKEIAQGSKAIGNRSTVSSGVSTTKPVFSGSTGGRVHFGAYGSGSIPKRKSIVQKGGFGGSKPIAREKSDIGGATKNIGMQGIVHVASGMISGSVAKSKQLSVKKMQLRGSSGHGRIGGKMKMPGKKEEATTIEVLKNKLLQDSKTWPEIHGVKRTTKYSPFVLTLKENDIFVNRKKIESITPEEQMLLQRQVM